MLARHVPKPAEHFCKIRAAPLGLKMHQFVHDAHRMAAALTRWHNVLDPIRKQNQADAVMVFDRRQRQ